MKVGRASDVGVLGVSCTRWCTARRRLATCTYMPNSGAYHARHAPYLHRQIRRWRRPTLRLRPRVSGTGTVAKTRDLFVTVPRVPGSSLFKITSAQIQKAVHDALRNKSARSTPTNSKGRLSCSTRRTETPPPPSTVRFLPVRLAAEQGTRRTPQEQEPDGAAGLMRQRFAQMAPVAEESASAASDMDVTATERVGLDDGRAVILHL